MLSFTKRERVLLAILGVVVVCAGLFYFAYRPARTALNTLRDNLQILEGEGQEAQVLLQDKETYAAILEQDKAAYEGLRQSVLPPMLPEEIDALITGLVTKCSLAPVDLSIALAPGDDTDPETGEVQFPQKHYTVVLSVRSSSASMSSADTGKMGGTLVQIIRLIDEMNSTPGMSVREYVYEANALDRPAVMTVDLFYFDEAAFDRENGSIEVAGTHAEGLEAE